MSFYLYKNIENALFQEIALRETDNNSVIVELIIAANTLEYIPSRYQELDCDVQFSTCSLDDPGYIKASFIYTPNTPNKISIQHLLNKLQHSLEYGLIHKVKQLPLAKNKDDINIQSIETKNEKCEFSLSMSPLVLKQFYTLFKNEQYIIYDEMSETISMSIQEKNVGLIYKVIDAIEKLDKTPSVIKPLVQLIIERPKSLDALISKLQEIELDYFSYQMKYLCSSIINTDATLPPNLQYYKNSPDIAELENLGKNIVNYILKKRASSVPDNKISAGFIIDNLNLYLQYMIANEIKLKKENHHLFINKFTKKNNRFILNVRSNKCQLIEKLKEICSLIVLKKFHEDFLNVTIIDEPSKLENLIEKINLINKEKHKRLYLNNAQVKNLSKPQLTEPAIAAQKNAINNLNYLYSINKEERDSHNNDTWEINSFYDGGDDWTIKPTLSHYELSHNTQCPIIFSPNKSNSLLEHITIAFHNSEPSKNIGIISLIAIFKVGVTLTDLENTGMNKYFHYNRYDNIPSLTISIAKNPNEYSELSLFLKEINEIACLNSEVINAIKLFYYSGIRANTINIKSYFNHASLSISLKAKRKTFPFLSTYQYKWNGSKDEVPCMPYKKQYYGHPPESVSRLFKAIVTNDYKAVKTILIQNPELLKQPDPWGNFPTDIAFDIFAHFMYQGEVLEYILDTWRHLPYDSPAEESHIDALRHQYGWLACDALDFCDNSPFRPKNHKIRYRWHLRRIFLEKPPKDSCFHRAIRENNLSLVKKMLTENPELIESPDLLGFRPLSIAIGFQYYAVVELLLKFGASPIPYENKKLGFLINYFDDLFNAQVISLLLKYGASAKANLAPPLITSLSNLISEPSESNANTFEALLHYGATDIHNKVGINTFEYLISQLIIAKNSSIATERLMLYFNLLTQLSYIPKGLLIPEFSALPDITKDYIKTHNHRMLGFLNPKVQLKETKLITTDEKFQHVLTVLNDKLDAQSEIHFKLFSTTQLYDQNGALSEIGKSLFDVFFTGFKVQPIHYTEMEYFTKYFPQDKTDLTFVELGMINNEIKTYFSFKIYNTLKEPTVRIDHVGITPGFNLMDIAYFSFRLLLALKTQLNNAPLLATLELAYPGFAWAKILDEAKPSPKYNWKGYDRTLFEQTDFPPVDANHNAPAVIDVNVRRRTEKPLPSHGALSMNGFFSEYLGEDPNKTLCVAMDINMQAWDAYFKHIQRFGFTSSDLENMGSLMGVLVINMMPEQNQPSLPRYGH